MLVFIAVRSLEHERLSMAAGIGFQHENAGPRVVNSSIYQLLTANFVQATYAIVSNSRLLDKGDCLVVYLQHSS